MIVVTDATVDITLRADAVIALARQPIDRIGALDDVSRRTRDADDGETVTLSVAATLKRVGMEMRHLVDAPDAHRRRKPDHSLLRVLARAHGFRDSLIRGDGKTITELAQEHGVGSPYFTRILRLAFLAPDITAAILDGRQPIELSAKRLAATSDLPKAWADQRRELRIG